MVPARDVFDPRYADDGAEGPEDVRDFGVSRTQRERREKAAHMKYIRRWAEKMAAEIDANLRAESIRQPYVQR